MFSTCFGGVLRTDVLIKILIPMSIQPHRSQRYFQVGNPNEEYSSGWTQVS